MSRNPFAPFATALFACVVFAGAATGAPPHPAALPCPRFVPAPAAAPLHSPDSVGADVVVSTRSDGTPLLPDLARARGRFGAVTNQLRFTFNSPADPWTAADLDSLRRWSRDYYALAVQVFGPPAFDITVNVRKQTGTAYEGMYFASTNEMVMFMARADLFVHEMLHAFHDDVIFGVPVYVESLTRAAECAVLDALGYTVFSPHHMGYQDVHENMLDKPALSAPLGNLYATSQRQLLRYQLGGYAWEKPYLENAGFFAGFNARYYAALAADPDTRYRADAILACFAAAAPRVEGESFAAWSAHRHIFDTQTVDGPYVYQDDIDDEMPSELRTRVELFRRTGGSETPAYYDELIEWRAVDATGAVIASGGAWTDDYGRVEFTCPVPAAYVGRVAIVTTARTSDGVVADTTYRSARRRAGLFGAVVDATAGQVRAMPAAGGPAVTTSLTNGCFDFPSLQSASGPFRVTLTYPDGRTSTRVVTKDASAYYVLIGPGVAGALDVADGATTAVAFDCRVLPQPLVTRAVLRVTTTRSGPLRVALFDLQGRRVGVLQDTELAAAGTHEFAVTRAASGLDASGVYFVRVEAAEGVRVAKLVSAGR